MARKKAEIAKTTKSGKPSRRGRITANFVFDAPPPDTWVGTIAATSAAENTAGRSAKDTDSLQSSVFPPQQVDSTTSLHNLDHNDSHTDAVMESIERDSDNELLEKSASLAVKGVDHTEKIGRRTQGEANELGPVENTTEPQAISQILNTPERKILRSDGSSSGLSSPPSSLGSTPKGLLSPNVRESQHQADDDSSPIRSGRLLKRSIKTAEVVKAQPTAKRRKTTRRSRVVVSSTSEDSLDLGLTSDAEFFLEETPTGTTDPSPGARHGSKIVGGYRLRGTKPNRSPQSETAPADNQSNASDSSSVEMPIALRLGIKSLPDLKRKKQPIRPMTPSPEREGSPERRFYAAIARDLDWRPTKDLDRLTHMDRKLVIQYYGSDNKTHILPAASEQSRRGGRNNGRGSTRGARGGAGNGRHRGGKGRSKGRDDDSPEPPPLKKPQSHEDTMLIKHAKARQAELRRIFHTIGGQQAELLEMVAARDLARLVKKPKAHKQVPEYDELVKELASLQTSANDVARKQLEEATMAQTALYQTEKDVINDRYRIIHSDIREEHEKGAQGDLIIFRRAITSAQDETHTQDGSEMDFIPQYHELPEPDQNVRGYTSTRITDEKPFKRHLLTYDDEARRQVIDNDVRPVVEAFAQKKAKLRAEEERKKTQTLEALSEAAEKQLKEIDSESIAQPHLIWPHEEANSIALSCLADAAEMKSQLHYDQLIDRGVPAAQSSVLPFHHDASPALPSNTTKPAPGPPVQPTRRSLRNLQPNGIHGLNQTQLPTPVTAAALSPAISIPVTTSGPITGLVNGPSLAPAPPKIAPAPTTYPSSHPPPQRPPPIDTRAHIPTPPEKSPVRATQNQTPVQQAHSMAQLQPRHMSQGSLPPPAPQYAYPQPFSPTHPPQSFPPPQSHHVIAQPYQHGPPPPHSPYHQQNSAGPVYLPYPPAQPYQGYPPPFYPGPLQHQQQPHPQQQYSFMPPQQGPAPPQQSQGQNPPSITQNNVPPQAAPYNQPPNQQPQHHHHHHAPPQNPEPYPNGYHAHNRTLSNPFQPPTQLGLHHPPTPVTSQLRRSQQTPQPQPPVPPHTTGTKGRAKKQKHSLQFVNQTQATRRLATEHQAMEEQAAAAAKKDKKKDKDKEGKGRKLAPKV